MSRAVCVSFWMCSSPFSFFFFFPCGFPFFRFSLAWMTAENVVRTATAVASLCDARAVDAQLLYNSCEAAAANLLRRSRRYVTATRVSSLAVAASIGGAGLIASWHYRRIYRVWRLRYPARVAQQRRVMWFLAASGLALLLFVLSPVGFMAQHEARLHDVQRLDAIAVRALMLKRRYESLVRMAPTSSEEAAKRAGAYNRCEEDWAELMRERVAIDENV
ncbi:hypothetical protein ECC02_002427 [Trypanosoma cruzi]|uniref:Uncharacterized protein n=3 Tax=Trypanosoma cruzi TaxID=5693 RepID=Q4D9V1_TRYCC|nr:hypothetical protein, conserved [Trypanosoma cruzi]EAN89299.1 hypothetical protein, conserved [Trypanosoma cruzi]KAF5224484.1 hypothetical protein ECC02_002427 [Trypanosoma cruzi]|eukprot:XP_811150.1 hypothetical protein [Trypanosoma cruzi strain CL Brener]